MLPILPDVSLSHVWYSVDNGIYQLSILFFYFHYVHSHDPLVILIEGKRTGRRFDLGCYLHYLLSYPRGILRHRLSWP